MLGMPKKSAAFADSDRPECGGWTAGQGGEGPRGGESGRSMRIPPVRAGGEE